MLGEGLILAIMTLAQMPTYIMAFVIGTVAFIVAKSKLLEGLRNKITHPFFKKLINCPYCLSFWLAGIWIILDLLDIFIMFVILILLIGGLGGIVTLLITWLCKKANL